MQEVELLDATGRSAGTAEKMKAHQAPGLLHRGFSVFLFDARGRALLQRRADSKYHFAGRWSNTCCGHPMPGVDLVAFARNRLRDELGIDAELEIVGSFRYRAVDVESRLVEVEDDTVLVGYVPASAGIECDPAEVSATRFLGVQDLRAEMEASPSLFTPWLSSALGCAEAAGHPR